MAEYLMRDDAPIASSVWTHIDDLVVNTLRRTLVARHFLDMVGPVGYGYQVAPQFTFAEEDGAIVTSQEVQQLELVEISRDFRLRARQLLGAKQTAFQLDASAAAIAAVKVARAEDRLLIGGLTEHAPRAGFGDWDTMGGPFSAVSAATATLLSAGFVPPYALVLSPGTFARLASLMHGHRREIEIVREIIQAGIFQWPEMPDNQALVLSPQPWNMDMVVGQDIVTAWVGNEGLDQRFRVFETVALRVKNPDAAILLQ